MFSERERPLMPAQFALRVAILSGLALVMFSIIFFRLWYLQVLSGDKYLKAAENNQVREITVRAPRGEILDRNGHALVANRAALALQLQPTELPRSHRKRQQEFARLGQVIGMSPDQIQRQLRQQTKELPANPVTLKRDVDYDLVYYLRENQARYPGVSVQHVYVRSYPKGSLAAQIFGYVREVTEEQLKEARYQGLVPGDQVGQSGVENTYDNVLRGANGMTRVQVDAQGRPTGGVLSQTQPQCRRQPAVDDRQPRAGGGRGGPGRLQHPGRLRGHERARRRDPRAGLLAHLRPLRVHEAGDPSVDLRPDLLGRGRVPVHEPRDSGPVPDGIDLQADHGRRGAGERGADADDHDRRRGHVHDRRPQLQERRGRRLRGAPAARGPPGLLRRLLLQPRRRPLLPGRRAAALGLGAGDRAPDRDRHPRRGRRPSADARVAQRALQGGRHRPALDRGRQRQPLGRPGRPADQPAPDGGRLRRDRQRGRRRPAPRRHGGRGRERPRRAGDRSGAAAPRRDRPAAPAGDPPGRSHGRAVAWRDLVLGVRQLPDPDGGQDGDRGALSAGGPVVVRRPRALSEPRDRGRGDDRAGGLRRRGGGARDLQDPRGLLQRPRAEAARRPEERFQAGPDSCAGPSAAPGSAYE